MAFLFCAQPINSVLGSQTAINSDKIYGEFTYSRDEENSDVLVQAKEKEKKKIEKKSVPLCS